MARKRAQLATAVESTPDVSTGRFVRIENKFLLPRAVEPQLLELLSAHAKRGFPEYARFSLIESLYFDADTLSLFRDHFMSPQWRFKLRVRRYAPEGKWEDGPLLLEMKEKRDALTDKWRFRIGRTHLERMSVGEPLPAKGLVDLNPELDPGLLHDRWRKVTAAAAWYQLRPRCRVLYQRRAFETEGARITLDDQLNYALVGTIDPGASRDLMSGPCWPRAESMRERYRKQDALILEVKHEKGMPAWLAEFLVRGGYGQARFSKYCFAIAESLWA